MGGPLLFLKTTPLRVHHQQHNAARRQQPDGSRFRYLRCLVRDEHQGRDADRGGRAGQGRGARSVEDLEVSERVVAAQIDIVQTTGVRLGDQVELKAVVGQTADTDRGGRAGQKRGARSVEDLEVSERVVAAQIDIVQTTGVRLGDQMKHWRRERLRCEQDERTQRGADGYFHRVRP